MNQTNHDDDSFRSISFFPCITFTLRSVSSRSWYREGVSILDAGALLYPPAGGGSISTTRTVTRYSCSGRVAIVFCKWSRHKNNSRAELQSTAMAAKISTAICRFISIHLTNNCEKETATSNLTIGKKPIRESENLRGRFARRFSNTSYIRTWTCSSRPTTILKLTARPKSLWSRRLSGSLNAY